MTALAGKRVLITGASGFIGGRLAEKLALEHGAHVRALVRDYGRAIRLARIPAEFVAGDIHDREAVEAAVSDCDYVVHCAHDFSDQWSNLDASAALAQAASRHVVRRMVYVSSMSVYEPLPPEGVIDESSPTPAGNDYAAVKLAVEDELERVWREDGLQTVSIRPAIVYGPYSAPWTLQPVAALRSRRVVLPERGEGTCWAVYVDDVADALIAALVRPEAVGERFLIGGPDVVSWGDFYGAYQAALGVDSLERWETSALQRSQTVSGAVIRPGALLAHPRAKQLYWKARGFGGHRFWHHMRERVKPLQFPATEAQVALFATHARTSSAKARALLGYEPRFDLEHGMSLTSDYIHWAQLDQAWA